MESVEGLVKRRKELRLRIEALGRGNAERRTETAEERRRLQADLDSVNTELRERGAR
jgi:hypothetical protein